MATYKYEWESIDSDKFAQAGYGSEVQVTKDGSYIDAMQEQADKVLAYWREHDTENKYRIKWNNHDFGMYCEVEKQVAYEDEDDEDSDDENYD